MWGQATSARYGSHWTRRRLFVARRDIEEYIDLERWGLTCPMPPEAPATTTTPVSDPDTPSISNRSLERLRTGFDHLDVELRVDRGGVSVEDYHMQKQGSS